MQPSPELRLMLAPAREYGRLAGQAHENRVAAAIARAALTVLILGVTSAFASTGRVDAPVVASGALCWSFVLVIQFAAALIVIRSAPNRRLDVRRSLALWTLAHGPWSLWMLIGASAAFVVPAMLSLDVVLLSALAPTAWTAALMLAYCGRVLGDDRRRALWRTAAHQLVMWSCIIGYLALATQIWPRLLGRLAA